MNTEILEIKTSIYISRTAAEIYTAIVDPEHMTQYFISESSGKMADSTDLLWKFPEFEEECPVHVVKVLQDEYISFYWDVGEVKTFNEIKILEKDAEICHVIITEKNMANNAAGIKWLKSNTEGWANFLTCLKAYLEFGINLRKGAFKAGV